VGPTRKGMAVRMQTHNRIEVAPIWNVVSVIPSKHYGTDEDRIVVLGNHRDA
jgi:hypothetical protein